MSLTWNKKLYFKIHGSRAVERFALQHICQRPSSIFGSAEYTREQAERPVDHFDYIFNNNKQYTTFLCISLFYISNVYKTN